MMIIISHPSEMISLIFGVVKPEELINLLEISAEREKLVLDNPESQLKDRSILITNNR